MKKYNISFLSNSISHEGRLQVNFEANSDTHAIVLFREKYEVLEPFNVSVQRYVYVDDSELDVR